MWQEDKKEPKTMTEPSRTDNVCKIKRFLLYDTFYLCWVSYLHSCRRYSFLSFSLPLVMRNPKMSISNRIKRKKKHIKNEKLTKFLHYLRLKDLVSLQKWALQRKRQTLIKAYHWKWNQSSALPWSHHQTITWLFYYFDQLILSLRNKLLFRTLLK